MSNLYLMSAFALTEKRRAGIDEISKHWANSVVYVLRSRSGKQIFAVSSGHLMGITVGTVHNMVKDTGRGYAYVSAEDAELTVENIIVLAPCVSTSAPTIVRRDNHIGLSEKRAIYVFK